MLNLPFTKNRQSRWAKLETLLKKIEKSKIGSLSKEELLELGILYQQTISDLALAKTQSLPEELIYYLNDLVSRAYHRIYRIEKTSLKQIGALFSTEFPLLFRQNWQPILFTFALLVFGWLLGFGGYLIGPKVIGQLLPSDFAAKFIKSYQNDTWFNEPLASKPWVSSWIMVNNIKVAIGAFAGGMLLGTLTCYLIIFNGFIIGVLSAIFWNSHYFLSFWAMILPHGVIELTAICLSAAAGFLLARAIFFPGQYRRADALKIQGPDAMKLMFATLLMFVIAGLIEGYLSTVSTKLVPESYRLGFAGLTAIFLFWYFTRKPKPKKAN